jgi:hypothetical protein
VGAVTTTAASAETTRAAFDVTRATDATTDAAAEGLAVAALDLARHFHQGATLWCCSPRWPSHARHLAVEFVHPVIVGTRALPARVVEGGDAAATVRLLSRAGDILVGVGPPDDPVVDDLMRRSDAWGLLALRLGAGDRPPTTRADHLLWVDGTKEAASDGGVVVLYHLLWELTHVALEHPGLLTPVPECDGDHCVTCSDEGTVAEVRSVEGDRAAVLAAGRTEVVDVSLVAPVETGELVLVHAGVALCTLGGGP